MKRSTPSHSALGEKADSRPNTAKTPIVIAKPVRRPMRSAIVPQNQAPQSMPTNVEDTTSEDSNVLSPKSSVIAGRANASRKISAASAAQVNPQTASNPSWNRPKPMRSMASCTVTEPAPVALMRRFLLPGD
jgi:hypothetical protein